MRWKYLNFTLYDFAGGSYIAKAARNNLDRIWRRRAWVL